VLRWVENIIPWGGPQSLAEKRDVGERTFPKSPDLYSVGDMGRVGRREAVFQEGGIGMTKGCAKLFLLPRGTLHLKNARSKQKPGNNGQLRL